MKTIKANPLTDDVKITVRPPGYAIGFSDLLCRLESTVADLADPMEWNWTRQGLSERDAADAVLRLMARAGLIEHRRHPFGGDIWKVNGKLYGRLDDITLEKFDALASERPSSATPNPRNGADRETFEVYENALKRRRELKRTHYYD